MPRNGLIVGAALVALTLIGLLVAQLMVLSSQKATTDRQLARQVELVRPVVRALREARLPWTAREALAGRLPERVAEAARTARTAVHLARDSLALQHRLLAIQLEALGVLRESLAIQRQTLQHAESIDRKTGGTAAAPPAPALP